MMDFIMMTVSFTMAILLAGVLSMVILMQPKVMKMYMNHVTKMSNQMVEEMFKDEDKDL